MTTLWVTNLPDAIEAAEALQEFCREQVRVSDLAEAEPWRAAASAADDLCTALRDLP